MAKRQYPLSIRDVAPGPDAVRLTGKRPDGASDGFHTGGAWLYQGKVWKPLDGRPYANANVHIETNEEDCLKALQGKSLFPKNWEIKETNGRRFLVRDHVPTFPGGTLHLSLEQIYQIEVGINEMNSLHWEVNDDIVIGKDRQGRLFIVDLSAANHVPGGGTQGANDSDFFNRLCKQAGHPEVAAAKSVARELSVQVVLNPKFKSNRTVRYFYSSDREVKIKGAVDLNDLTEDIHPKERQVAKKYFWVGSEQPLTDVTIKAHGLRLRHARKAR